MTAPVELIPLKCIRCDTMIPATINEVAWVCKQCGQGQQLSENGLVELDVNYAKEIPPAREGRPFWVCEGRVSVMRDTYTSLRKKNKQAENFWSQPRNFFIPAFDYSLDQLTRLGIDWLRNPPTLNSGPAVNFKPVTVALGDLHSWAEFLVLGLEAERKDKVKSIRSSIQMAKPQLWILP